MPEPKLYWVQWVDERWRVSHRNLTLSVHVLKQDAVAAGVRVAQVNRPSSLNIYAADGTLEAERNYDDESFPSTQR